MELRILSCMNLLFFLLDETDACLLGGFQKIRAGRKKLNEGERCSIYPPERTMGSPQYACSIFSGLILLVYLHIGWKISLNFFEDMTRRISRALITTLGWLRSFGLFEPSIHLRFLFRLRNYSTVALFFFFFFLTLSSDSGLLRIHL